MKFFLMRFVVVFMFVVISVADAARGDVLARAREYVVGAELKTSREGPLVELYCLDMLRLDMIVKLRRLGYETAEFEDDFNLVNFPEPPDAAMLGQASNELAGAIAAHFPEYRGDRSPQRWLRFCATEENVTPFAP